MIDTKTNYPGPEASQFPNAPDGWSVESALDQAEQEGLKLGQDHWEIIQAIQLYFIRHEQTDINVRELLDALDEKYHRLGGKKFLYRLLPGGPVAQGCRLAGISAPAGSTDLGFGSVQ